MKVRSILFPSLFVATVFALLINCAGKKEEAATEAHNHAAHDSTHASGAVAEASETQFQADTAFQQQLASVFTAYVSLKNAFVSSDVSKVKVTAAGTTQALNNVDMKLLSGAAHHDWMNYLMPLQSTLKEIEASSNLEAQRKSFSTLSDNLYKSIKAFGIDGKEAFYAFCPMAFNNQGGYWLSDQPQIRNPYFGDKMLTCGEVKEKLKASPRF